MAWASVLSPERFLRPRQSMRLRASELLRLVEPGVDATDNCFAGRDTVREERLEKCVAVDATGLAGACGASATTPRSGLPPCYSGSAASGAPVA